MSKEKYDVYSEFDIDKHAEHFINYLEVCISPEGKIHYAVPSHTQFLENILKQQCAKQGKDWNEFINEHIDDWPNCLCDLTGYCMVWNDMLYKSSLGLTRAQADALFALRTKHYTQVPHLSLYQGTL